MSSDRGLTGEGRARPTAGDVGWDVGRGTGRGVGPGTEREVERAWDGAWVVEGAGSGARGSCVVRGG